MKQHNAVARACGGLLLVAVLLGSGVDGGAQQIGPSDACRHARANVQGIARAPITVSTTAVTVIAKNPAICKAIIFNKSSTQMVNCAGINDGDPTAVAGFPVPAGAALSLDLEAQDGWRCVRDTSATADADLAVLELYQ